MTFEQLISRMDMWTAPPKDGDYDAHVHSAIKTAYNILSTEFTDTCPECGTTELLCGHNGPGCIHEEEEENNG